MKNKKRMILFILSLYLITQLCGCKGLTPAVTPSATIPTGEVIPTSAPALSLTPVGELLPSVSVPPTPEVAPTMEPTDTPIPTEPVKNPIAPPAIKIAEGREYVVWGSYEQDGEEANGKEPIEWIVLTKNEKGTLLLSRYALDCKPFHNAATEVKWSDSSIRAWLNETFLNAAFTEEEQSFLMTVTFHPEETDDPVFLLSSEEAEKYLKNDTERQCKATAYAIKNGAGQSTKNGNNSWWWLRTLGKANNATYVGSAGSVYYEGDPVISGNDSVRPAVWVKVTPTEEPEITPTEEPTPEVTPTEEPTPTAVPTKAPTPTPKPTKAPTPAVTKAPTNTPTPTPTKGPTPTPTPYVSEDGTCTWGRAWSEPKERKDIAAALFAKVNAFRAGYGLRKWENPYVYYDVTNPGLGDRLTSKGARVCKDLVLNWGKMHESSQISAGTVRSFSDPGSVDAIAQELFNLWKNSPRHNANMRTDSSGYGMVDVAVMHVYEYFNGSGRYYQAVMTVSSVGILGLPEGVQ